MNKNLREFIKKMDWTGLAKAFAEGDIQWHAKEWKEFIEKIEANAKEKAHKELCEYKEIPMGVSQWRNHGKKWGYWEYWEKQIRQKTIKEILEKPIIKEFLEATSIWLGSLRVWDIDDLGCKMCGAKYDKIKEFHQTLQNILTETKEKNNDPQTKS